MYSLKIALLLALSLPLMEQHAPIAAWLDAASIKSSPAIYSQAEMTINFNISFPREFAGEIAIISSKGVEVHQNYYFLSSGTHRMSINTNPFKKGHYLVVMHDFEQRFLKTIKITVEESDK